MGRQKGGGVAEVEQAEDDLRADPFGETPDEREQFLRHYLVRPCVCVRVRIGAQLEGGVGPRGSVRALDPASEAEKNRSASDLSQNG
jgi:hypothetical protein